MMHNLVVFIQDHAATVTLIVGAVGTAFASTLPDTRPKTLDDWWAWGSSFIHQLANAKHPTQAKP